MEFHRNKFVKNLSAQPRQSGLFYAQKNFSIFIHSRIDLFIHSRIVTSIPQQHREGEMEGKHTEGPWKVVKVPYKSSAYYISGEGKDARSPFVAHIPRSTIQPMEANAEFIVLACNAHSDLVKALELTRKELQACQAVIHLAGGFDPSYVNQAQLALKIAESALAKAGAA